ncbi:hypothetical protein AAFF_G00301600 [Aldrovandia affinis]|uniref:Uncharacterized protein n=1 Tax=Aldrovandia affinis TaxID=143900 RepID=A0AAD7WRC4_9TELE|nr:hypothetical protein AAFF_G00301600 [Aldrovandia affinis]
MTIAPPRNYLKPHHSTGKKKSLGPPLGVDEPHAECLFSIGSQDLRKEEGCGQKAFKGVGSFTQAAIANGSVSAATVLRQMAMSHLRPGAWFNMGRPYSMLFTSSLGRNHEGSG